MSWRKAMAEYEASGQWPQDVLVQYGELGLLCLYALFSEFSRERCASQERLVNYRIIAVDSLNIRPTIKDAIKQKEKVMDKVTTWNTKLYFTMKELLLLKTLAYIEHSFNYHLEEYNKNILARLWNRINRRNVNYIKINKNEQKQLYLAFTTGSLSVYMSYFKDRFHLVDDRLVLLMNLEKELQQFDPDLRKLIISENHNDETKIALHIINIRLLSAQYIGQLYFHITRNYYLEKGTIRQ